MVKGDVFAECVFCHNVRPMKAVPKLAGFYYCLTCGIVMKIEGMKQLREQKGV
jgi:hypothetical protein